MPLFKCSKCGCIDNTAVGNYWSTVYREDGTKGAPLCAECDPEIGKWHALFEKKTPEQLGYVELADGFFGPKGGWR